MKLKFSFWFFAALALFVAVNPGVLPLYLALPILIHECGHLAAMMLCGIKIREIRFTAFGVIIRPYGAQTLSPTHEMAVTAAGVLANLLVAASLYFFAFASMRIMLLTAANLAVAAFNLLPVGGLDGGTLVALWSERFFSPRTAYILSRAASFCALVPLFAAAIFLLLQPERNFTLLIVCLYLAGDVIANS